MFFASKSPYQTNFCTILDSLPLIKIFISISEYSDLINLTRRPQSPNRSPIFSRQNPAIQRSYLRDQDGTQLIREQLEKHQRRRKVPEVVTLEDRPKIYESSKDKDVIEIIDVVSPPKSPSKKKITAKGPNTLAREFALQNVCQPDFLQQLREKYDKRKGKFCLFKYQNRSGLPSTFTNCESANRWRCLVYLYILILD